MAKKTPLNEEDKAAFTEAMKGVKRISHSKVTHLPTPPLPKLRPKTPTDPDTIHFQFSDYETLEPVTSEDTLEFSRSGVQQKILRKMRTGQYTIEASLDLHGMIVEEAREALAHFIGECRRKRIRNVLIIHGKGRAHHNPILKNKLNNWLRQTNEILAFCSVKTKDGSTGSIYVLLKGPDR
jgi:DNA-nicking Smr family endonuclease